MNKKQLLLLFFGILVPWTVGNGLLPILPVYALQIEASEAKAGYCISCAFVALAAGTILAGWLSDKFQRRKLLLTISAAAAIPSLWLMGKARNIVQLAGTTAALWFSLGMALTIITVLVGLSAGKDERGKLLGLIGMSNGLGSMLGGLSVGPVIDRWGYPAMFMMLSIFSVILLISAIFVEDVKVERKATHTSRASAEKPGFGRAFFVLLLAQFIVITAHSMAALGRSLSMNNLGFSVTAISSTLVVSGLVSIPFPFILGWLSDRLGRKKMMAFCYLSYIFCILILAFSRSLWHFWIVIIFLKVGMGSLSVGPAFVADLVDPATLGRGVSLFQSMGWFAFAIGYAVVGNAFQFFGMATTSFVSIALPVIGIMLIFLIRLSKHKEILAGEIR